MGHYEEQAQEDAQHHLPQASHQGYQVHLVHGPAHLSHEEAGALHAYQAQDVHPEPGPDDQILSYSSFFYVHQYLINAKGVKFVPVKNKLAR